MIDWLMVADIPRWLFLTSAVAGTLITWKLSSWMNDAARTAEALMREIDSRPKQ